ncbi:MAG TPA: hypothetical protein VGK74_12195 [Symbiobacteriaceae bacterium]|jgi:hypothetical protein
MTFSELQTEMLQVYRAGEFAAALALVDRKGPNYPEEASTIALWRVCLTAVQGQTDGALQIMADTLAAGSWFSERLRNDPDVKGLQGHPEFERMYTICQERQVAAQAQAKRLRLTVEPAGPADPAPAGPAPLLMALHGNDSNAGREVDRWRPVAAQGWRVAMLQSAEVDAPNRFIWNDLERVTGDVTLHHAELIGERPVRDGKLLVGGFSMGAGRSIWLAATGVLPARGFIAVGPWLADVTPLREALQAKPPEHLRRGYIVVGEADVECLRVSREVQSLLGDYGIPVELEVLPGMGHVYPETFEKSLERAISFLCQ